MSNDINHALIRKRKRRLIKVYSYPQGYYKL